MVAQGVVESSNVDQPGSEAVATCMRSLLRKPAVAPVSCLSIEVPLGVRQATTLAVARVLARQIAAEIHDERRS